MSIYDELGLKKIINAWGTVTRIGGTTLSEEVLSAMADASRSYVDLEQLLAKSGERIASLLHVEAALITSGAAAGLTIATAACLAGDDQAKIHRLPDTEGMANEVIVLKSHRSRYDQGIRMAGARLVEVGLADLTLPEQLQAALSDRTVAMFYLAESEGLRGALPLQTVSAILGPRGIPIIVDAAAEIPPLSNIGRYFRDGASLVVLSGGKDIRGPQSSGLILGDRRLVRCCLANSNPNHSIGRPMKVDKETIAGLTKAVELYVRQDPEARMRRWEEMAARFVDGLQGLPGVTVTKGIPVEPGIQPRIIPRAFLTFSRESAGLSPQELRAKLMAGDPPIAVGLTPDGVVLNPHVLEQDQVETVIDRVRSMLRRS